MSTGMGVQIRRMASADLPAVGVLAGRLVRMHYAFDPKRFMRPIDPERGYARWFATQLDDEEVFLLTADDEDGSVIGYVYARLEPRSYNDLLDAHAKLHDVFVDERARGRGVGEALVREALRLARERGAPRMLLATAAQNEPAQRLFRRLGFRTTMLEMTVETSGAEG